MTISQTVSNKVYPWHLQRKYFTQSFLIRFPRADLPAYIKVLFIYSPIKHLFDKHKCLFRVWVLKCILSIGAHIRYNIVFMIVS